MRSLAGKASGLETFWLGIWSLEDPYVVLDLVEQFVQGLQLRKTSKKHALTALRSFFLHNRAELPRNPNFRVISQRPSVRGLLSAKDVVELCHAATVRFRSVILFKWQSFTDTARLLYANEHCSDQIVQQIQQHILPVRIDLPGRKVNENDIEGEYFTYIDKDAVDALEKYFDERRGWPRKGEPMWLQKDGRPLTHWTFDQTWLRLLRRVGKIPPSEGPRGSRYGYNPHEMRDEATTRLHISLKAQGFDMDCVKFWCGQVGQVDRLKYDKFYKEQTYVRDQYQIAAPYLNILSNWQPPEVKAVAKENEELRNRPHQSNPRPGGVARPIRNRFQRQDHRRNLTQFRFDAETFLRPIECELQFLALQRVQSKPFSVVPNLPSKHHRNPVN